MIAPEHLDAAMLAAEPLLVSRRRMTADMEKPSKAWLEEITTMENAARVRVRRVVAALNGIDVESTAAAWTDPPAIVPRTLIAELCEAFCDEKVFTTVEKQLGPDKAAALMGVITAL